MSLSAFLLVFARLAALMLTMPLVGRGLPLLARGGLVFALALALSPLVVGPAGALYARQDDDLLAQLVCELGLGLLLGLMVRLILDLAPIAGAMLALPLGLSLSQILSNESREQVALSGQLLHTLGLLLFVSDGIFQRFTFFALQRSFELVPRASQLLQVGEGRLAATLLTTLAGTFEQALLLALPLLLLLLLLFTAMGLTSRIVPQLNLLILGLPLQLALGLLFLLMLMPALSADMAALFARGLEGLAPWLEQLLAGGEG